MNEHGELQEIEVKKIVQILEGSARDDHHVYVVDLDLETKKFKYAIEFNSYARDKFASGHREVFYDINKVYPNLQEKIKAIKIAIRSYAEGDDLYVE